MSSLTQTASFKTFGGYTRSFKHKSATTKTDMVFSVFFPRECDESGSVPVIFYLSGLTCTDQNALTKGGFQGAAASRGVCMVFPDTSPRGANIPGEAESWDFGVGAGFYLTATTDKWKDHYNMYDYVVHELPALLAKEFPKQIDLTKKSIMGHSMGGHGALVAALKNPGMYAACSAFSPICNPMNCPWGIKAFTGYLGSDAEKWKAWDASQLCRGYKGPGLSILVDQGTDDDFLGKKQLLPDTLVESVKASPNLSLHMRMQNGYDHSYYFIQSFAKEHVDFHADYLSGRKGAAGL
jgi:S-formylglutathione hydrolase